MTKSNSREIAKGRRSVERTLERKLGVSPRPGRRGARLAPGQVAGEALPYWKRKTLAQMNKREWEALCDGCGKCCVHKLEYEETGDLVQTNVACKLLDHRTCQCSNYKDRKKYVPDCIKLTPKVVHEMDWLPSTCAYRLVLQGRDLYWWHPLVSGDPETVHEAGVSARGRVISETEAGDIEDHIVRWKT